MKETQRTISDWGVRTFGSPISGTVILERLYQEMLELRNTDYLSNDGFHKISDECADVLILLYQVADLFGFDLHACVDHKMEINRARKWKLNGDGTAQHE